MTELTADQILDQLSQIIEEENQSCLNNSSLPQNQKKYYCKFKSLFNNKTEHYINMLKDAGCFDKQNWLKNIKHVYFNLHDESAENKELWHLIINAFKNRDDALSIHNFNVRQISTNIETLSPFLVVLNIIDCELKVLNSEIFTLVNLEELKVTKCPLYEIAPEIKALTKLKSLTLSRLKIETIPDLSDLRLLEYLNISYNNLNKFPILAKDTKINTIFCQANLQLIFETPPFEFLKRLDFSQTKTSNFKIANYQRLQFLDMNYLTIDLDFFSNPQSCTFLLEVCLTGSTIGGFSFLVAKSPFLQKVSLLGASEIIDSAKSSLNSEILLANDFKKISEGNFIKVNKERKQQIIDKFVANCKI